MLKSCKYCGRMHKFGQECPHKPKRECKKSSEVEDRFRWSRVWQSKREEINNRDKHLCQVCIRLLYPYGSRKYNFNNIQVHHIDSLQEAYDKRLDNYNLLDICPPHHEMAERGAIPKAELQAIAREQEEGNNE